MELVTGYRGADHVTAEQLGDLQAGFAGYEHCVLPVGRKLEAEVVTANKVRIFDGALLTYGRQCVIEAGAYEDVTIENGSQGLLRNDMIVARYVKNEETGIESVNLAVIKGITGETAKDPVPLNGNIRDGAFENEMPLYRVKLKGLAIEGIDPLFNIMMSAKDLEEGISSLNGSLKAVSGTTHNIFDLRKGKKNTGSIVKNANDSSDFGTYLEDVNLASGNRTRLLLASGEVKIQYLSPTQAVIKEIMLGDLTK